MKTLSTDINHRAGRCIPAGVQSSTGELIEHARRKEEHESTCHHDDGHESGMLFLIESNGSTLVMMVRWDVSARTIRGARRPTGESDSAPAPTRTSHAIPAAC